MGAKVERIASDKLTFILTSMYKGKRRQLQYGSTPQHQFDFMFSIDGLEITPQKIRRITAGLPPASAADSNKGFRAKQCIRSGFEQRALQVFSLP